MSSVLLNRPRFMNGESKSTEINPTGMYSEVVMLTPKLARDFLDTIVKDEQRPRSRMRIEQYKGSIVNGEWKLTHQGIAIDTRGVQVDGQHRCVAVEECGIAVPIFVTWNVPTDSRLHMDEQLPRSAKDAIKMAGKGNYSTAVLSLARIFRSAPEQQSSSYSKEHLLEILKTYSEGINEAVSVLGHNVHGTTKSVRCVYARAWYHVDRQRLSEWAEILRTGMPVNPDADSAAIVYRNYLSKSIGLNGRSMETDRYQKGQASLRAFMVREKMTKVYGTTADLFPILNSESVAGDETES